jgi:LacI family transcriptional regulator, galactose operon repressor
VTSTIGDVARRAGVSTATVSRVLSGAGVARPQTRDRVLDAARALEFRPSLVARALKRRATFTLGLIVTDIENPYFPQLVRAVEDAARADGYAILLCNADDDADQEAALLDVLVERRVDGLIVASSRIATRQRAWLERPPVPVILVNTAARDLGVPSIVSDNRGGGELAARHLLDLGHSRFAYLLPPPPNVDAPERLAGVRDALAAAAGGGARGRTSLAIGHGAPTVEGGEQAVSHLLGGGGSGTFGDDAAAPRPTAILAYNDLMAIGALRAVRRAGLRVPQDVSLVGFDDVAFAAYAEPPLTTIRQATAEMGRWAVATLRARLARRTAGGTPEPAPELESVVLPVTLEIRASSAAAPTE